MFLFYHWFHFFLEDYPHCFIEHCFQTILSQSTALHILAFKLLLNYFSCSFSHYRSLLRIFFHDCVLVSQISFISHKNLWNIANILLQLRIPLYYDWCTFLRAFTKEEGSMTEKMMRKTSQFGYANGRSLLYYYWPAVSHSPRLIIFPSTLTVAA